jgi:hypothetical protein
LLSNANANLYRYGAFLTYKHDPTKFSIIDEQLDGDEGEATRMQIVGGASRWGNIVTAESPGGGCGMQLTHSA